jgi:hypothetical protein
MTPGGELEPHNECSIIMMWPCERLALAVFREENLEPQEKVRLIHINYVRRPT